MRGEAGQFPLDGETVRTVGSSLARHLAERSPTPGQAPRIVTGRDTRESGSWIEQAFTEGARSSGAECQSAGIITTPGVAFLTRTLPADAGVVVSASHNPYHDNGIKIFSPSGRKLDDATERLIEADIMAAKRGGDAATTQQSPCAFEEGVAEESAALQERYLDYLAQEVGGGLSLEGLTLVVDCANGAAYRSAPALFARLGARTISINCAPDGHNINEDCGSLHIDGLRRAVLEQGAGMGVAFDGDADRALFVDAQGEFVDGDATLWIMAQYLASREELKDGLVVATVMSNIGLEIALRSRGWTLRRTDVGDKYVLEELLRTEASVGGEQSGHIIFPRLSLAGDGQVTALALLRAMHDAGLRLDELARGFTRYPQVLVNVRVREKLPFDEVADVARAAEETRAQLGDRGRLLLRYSGTEPLARVMIEGEQQDVIEQQAEALASVIQQSLGAA